MKPMIRPDMARLAALLTADNLPPASQAARDLANVGVAKRQSKRARIHAELEQYRDAQRAAGR